ncbi:ankyrin repeat domain-containing protein [Actinoplanes sp. NPDC023801]|uniref:ankyrin repeat domain-containing protein n=1 Tax=Actinoplanes sp. NPDC023801 TaxID=3154595 RepID=UPI0034007D27
MTARGDMLVLDAAHPVAASAVRAIRTGDRGVLRELLAEHPRLATARLVDEDGTTSRSLLHVVTDWPGHFPDAVATVTALVAAGAEVDARFIGPHTETPLHWAASCDDVDALDALLDAGADIDAPGAVIGGGTPLDDAVAFAQWRAARRLVKRGARTTLWHAAALGLMDRLHDCLTGPRRPAPAEISDALWGACHGGQQTAAASLLDEGAELNRIPGWERLTPLDAAHRSDAGRLADWLRDRGAMTAAELDQR